MKGHQITRAMAVAVAAAVLHTPAAAQTHPHIHGTGRWKECSIQLDPSLKQGAWRQFTKEAGLVSYFRPLVDAESMGRGKFEISAVQWDTGIDDDDSAWNDTFVHPDTTHYLFEGDGLKFPGLTARIGVTNTTDVGLYFTKNPNANYGFYGAQVQRRLVGGESHTWAASARASFVSLYGPADVNLTTYGVDLVASRRVALSRWAAVSPYVGVSGYVSTSHEKSALVTLADEHVGGGQAMAGAVLQLSKARIAAEYNAASVRTISLKVGVGR